MELNMDDRRLIAGLVGAGMDRTEATEAVTLAARIVRGALDSFKSIADAAVVCNEQTRSGAVTVATMQMFEIFSQCAATVHAVGQKQSREMGSEQADILRYKAARAMFDFEG